VATKQRQVDAGVARGRSILVDLGRELRDARMEHGLSQSQVARSARTSRSQVSRVEHAAAPAVSIPEMARLLAVVGLELSSRAYPAGPPIRDAAHLALLERLRRLAPSTCAWRYEVPIGMPGDRRAWDAVLTIGAGEVAVEAETRPRDLQSLLRRVAGKLRDSQGPSAAILLLSNTRHNRRLLVDHGDVIASAFPAPGTEILSALESGTSPRRSGVLLL
jgi:transcriptional regulator with XRE-family HTH domain